MNALVAEGSHFVATLPGVPEGSSVHCQPCKSLKYGDLWVGRHVATPIKNQLSAEGALTKEGELSTVRGKYGCEVFTSVRFNPQGQLCLALNRSLAFRTSIQEVLYGHFHYGHHHTTYARPIVLTDYCTFNDDSQTIGYPWQLSVSESRIILIKKLLCRILSHAGHCVKESQLTEKESIVSDSEPNLVEQFFRFLSGCDSALLSTPSSMPPRGDDVLSVSGIESSIYVHYSRPHPPQSLLCDGKRFVQERGLIGRRGYDKNIDQIKVKAEDGSMSREGIVANTMRQIHSALSGGAPSGLKMIHVTNHTHCFKLQEAMILAEVCAEFHQQSPPLKQHLILCSDVVVSEGDRETKDYPLASLLHARHKQMTAAYCVKYGAKGHDPEVQSVVSRMAGAVVKFELLSTDPQSKIKLTVPTQSTSGTDVRFDGSFVLYNYARLANLLNNFDKACKLGTYPPLPDISFIDFSLLNDEEEWHILFHYVLQYPPMVADVSSSICDSETVRIETKLKKICQFLTQMSHSVSSYYSRVKILMAPEAHLVPLIHARLMLVKAVKQTMYNALQLLAIEPPEQL